MATYEDSLNKNIGINIAKEGGGSTTIVVPATDFSYTVTSEAGRVFASGRRVPLGVYASSVKFSGSFSTIIVPSIFPVLSLINSDAGKALPVFDINDGTDKLISCKMSSLKIAFSIGKPITADFSFVALGKDTGSTVSSSSDSTFFIAQNVTLAGIADYDCDDISISISNGLKEVYGMQGTDRTPRAIAEDKQEIDIEIKFLEDTGLDVSADDITAIETGSISVTGSDGETDLEISFIDLVAVDASKDIKVSDIIRFGLKYVAKTIAFPTVSE